MAAATAAQFTVNEEAKNELAAAAQFTVNEEARTESAAAAQFTVNEKGSYCMRRRGRNTLIA